MVYRVIREELDKQYSYDFDDLDDAKAWIVQEMGFDDGSETTTVIQYNIIEIEA